MERNYVGQGAYAGSSSSNLISSGRRAGTVRSASGDERPPLGYASSQAVDNSAGGHMARYGRRASPGAVPSGDGMEMDPPGRYHPSAATGRPAAGSMARAGPAAPSSGAAAPGSASGGGISSKLSGLQRLKEASTARLVSRIPSANGRSSGDAGYVPSAMTNQQPARNPPGRSGSGGGSAGSAAAYGSSAPSYGGSAGARSTSTGPSMGAPARPPSGRSAGYGSSSGAAAGGGYSSSAASSRQPPPQQQKPAAAGYGSRGAAPPSNDYDRYQQPAAAAAPPARRPAPAAAPPPAAAAPSHPMARPHHHHNAPAAPQGGGFGSGGGYGGNFGPGSIPPGAEDAVAMGPMVECPTCGRNFNQQAYSKHAKVCEKVFATKRKPVNMAAKRLEGSEAVKFFDLRKGVPKSEAKPAGPAAGGRGGGRGGAAVLDDRPLPPSKVPKWKAQSEQLRAAMSANRQIADAKAKGVDIRDVKFAPGPSVPDDRVQCPHCGRKFAELTAERHIPKCRDIQAKPGRLAAGGGKGAHMRR